MDFSRSSRTMTNMRMRMKNKKKASLLGPALYHQQFKGKKNHNITYYSLLQGGFQDLLERRYEENFIYQQ